jgi:tetratricopeptide (TPR) repeat protein
MARKVLDVFLSSTGLDLAAHRAEVHRRLTGKGYFHCVWQEDFGPQSAGAVEFCRREAQKAEFFVGLIGLRRGWEPDGDNGKRSITEMEHDWAKEARRRRFVWVTPDDFPVPGSMRESDAEHGRQQAFRKRIMGGGELVVGQKGFASPELLGAEVEAHLLAHLVGSDLIMEVRPDLAGAGSAVAVQEEVPAVAAAVERLAEDNDIDLLALAKDPKGTDVAELEAKLQTRAKQHEAAGERERKASAEYWRHTGALARLQSRTRALAAYSKAAALDPTDGEALLWCGLLARDVGNLAASEQACKRLLALDGYGASDQQTYWARLGLGDIAMERGNLGEAQDYYRAAKDQVERLAATDPTNTVWQRDLSASHNRIGDILVGEGNLAEALESYRSSLAIRERLARSDPNNAGGQRDLSVSWNKLGDVLMARGSLAEALESYHADLAIAERLAKSDPNNAGWQRDLSVSHNKIGDVLVAQGNLAKALQSFQDSLTIRELLAKSDPSNAGWQRDLSTSHTKIGDVLVAQGNLLEALDKYRASLAIDERLAKSDPSNASWQRDLSVSHNKIGDALRDRDNLSAALEHYRASFAIRERLAKSDPNNANWQRDLAIIHGRIAMVLARQGSQSEAVRTFDQGHSIIVQLRQLSPDNATLPKDLAWFEEQLAALKK